MAKALQPAVKAGSIFFELDRFESSAGERLELTGRWFGVRGRRFMRPNLVLVAADGQFRALADLEHKPWAAEDGEPWRAAFPWSADAELLEAELTVAPDITIQLPAPNCELAGSERLPAKQPEVPKRPARETKSSDSRRRKPAARAQAGEQAAGSTRLEAAGTVRLEAEGSRRLEAGRRTDELAESRAEADRLRGALDSVRAELEAVRAELEAVRGELETERLTHAEAATAAEKTTVELTAALARRDAAVTTLEQTSAERDHAIAERDQAITERDRARESFHRMRTEFEQTRAAVEQTAGERDEASDARDRAIGQRDELLKARERIAHERDEAISARGAALVMRNAARALPSHDRHAGWFQRSVAIVVLVVVVFALLIVLHLL